MEKENAICRKVFIAFQRKVEIQMKLSYKNEE